MRVLTDHPGGFQHTSVIVIVAGVSLLNLAGVNCISPWPVPVGGLYAIVVDLCVILEDGSSGFPAESGRYHLYVSLACPFAHRALIVRKLKGLEDAISVDVVDWHLTDEGWHFNKDVSFSFFSLRKRPR